SLLSVSSFLQAYAASRDLHSSPTRRSSDLLDGGGAVELLVEMEAGAPRPALAEVAAELSRWVETVQAGIVHLVSEVPDDARAVRSEEHTSELQSLTNLVCRLLLDTKKPHRR